MRRITYSSPNPNLTLFSSYSYFIHSYDRLRHIILIQGSLETTYFESDPTLPFQYLTFMGYQWRLRAVYSGASPLLSDFSAMRMRRITWPISRGLWKPHIWPISLDRSRVSIPTSAILHCTFLKRSYRNKNTIWSLIQTSDRILANKNILYISYNVQSPIMNTFFTVLNTTSDMTS